MLTTGDESRWQQQVKEGVMLKAASRGQEFILDCDDYPEAVSWLAGLMTLAGDGLIGEQT